MIEELGNNNWEIMRYRIYAPNLITAIERCLKIEGLSDKEKQWLETILNEIKR